MIFAGAQAGKFVTIIMIMIVSAVGGMAARYFWPEWAEEIVEYVEDLPDDSPPEEFVEDVIYEHSGWNVDFTGNSPEVRNAP